MNRFAPTSLLIGNFVTGLSVMGPAGMLGELADGLNVSVRDASLLITFGAAVLCIGSPLTAWLTSRFDRRLLLTSTLVIVGLAHAASALAPNYYSLLALRLIMLAVVALFTPQAAGAAALMAPAEHRGSTMSFVFLGWSLSAAFGLPVVTYLASHFGWRSVYALSAGIAFIAAVLTAWRLPRGLFGAPVELETWGELFRNPLIVMLLLITVVQTSGPFVIFTFIGPVMTKLMNSSAETIASVFFVWGITGLIGNIIASRVVDSWGGWKTSLTCTAFLLLGVTGWALGSGVLVAMFAATVFWGLGFVPSNSMQQVRLAGAAPALASASVSLNTSSLYIGQAIGSGIGGIFYVRDMIGAMNIAAIVFVLVAIALVIATRPRAAIQPR
ncbi:MAG: MFS transporter [Afipia sp.]|nr:MFS transporter [Afipia sp.]